MSDETRLYYLRIALIVFGLIFVFGVYPPPWSGRRAGRGEWVTRTI